MCMTTLTITAARAELPRLVDRVQAGQEVTLTRHGEPVAVIVRPDIIRRYRRADVWTEADTLESRLESSWHRPLTDGSLSPSRADELVAAIRAERDER